MSLIHRIDHPAVEGIRVGKTDRKQRYRINTSCIVYRLGDTIIDTGPASEWKAIKSYLEERPVKRALLTHYHEDHSGNGGHVETCFNAIVCGHEAGHQNVSAGFDMNIFRKRVFGNIQISNPQALPNIIDTATVAGEKSRSLQAIHTPGHSDDMTCFYEANEGWLFSGDLYLSSKIKLAMKEESIAEQINSLESVLKLDFDELFCAHRGYIKEGKKALRAKLDFLCSLKQEVEYLHQKGLSVRAITRKLLGRDGLTMWLSQFEMSKINLIQACLK